MKIIDIAICTDNLDPKGIGRIRYVRYNDYVGEKEKALDYEPWSDRDIFIANPFLPVNINFIPEIGQAVKIINYDTDKDTVNAEYIAGPFTTTHNFNSQQFAEQVENTTYGIAVKHGQDVFDKNGEYRDKKAIGSIAKKTDYGVYGKYGSDIFFTEDGVQIRGGKLLSKEYVDLNNKQKMVSQPILSNKNASLHLKKFPKSLEYVEEEFTEEVTEKGQVKYFLEYELADEKDYEPTATTRTVNVFVYDVQKAGKLFRIETPNLGDVEITTGCTLVNKNNYIYKNNSDTTTPTYTITVTGNTELFVQMRWLLFNFAKKGISIFDSIYKEKETHPFYFRQSKKCRDLKFTVGSGPWSFRNELYNNTGYFQRVGKGLIFSKTSSFVPVKKVKKKKKYIKDDTGKREEQTFSSLKSDKIYLISTNTNEYSNPIDFTKLDKYEISHENYVKDIDPNTYSLVRGELLVEILQTMKNLFQSHVHGICTPIIPGDPNFIKLEQLLINLENDLLNKSIRIN